MAGARPSIAAAALRRAKDHFPIRKSAALVAYRALSDVAAKGSLLIVTVAAARALSGRAFGVFSLASTFGWIVAVTTDFGIQLHVARSVAARPADAPAILHRWLRVRLATAGAALVAVAAIASRLPSASDRAAVMLLAVAYVASGLVEFLHYFYRGLGRTDVESSLTLAQRGAVLVLALAALAWRPSLVPLAAAMTLPVVAALGVSLWYARRLAGRLSDVAGRAGHSTPRPAFEELRHDVIPIGAGIVLSALYFRVDLFLVEIWRGTGAVALYNGVFRLVEALRLFPAAVVAVVLPALCRAGDMRPAGRAAVIVAAPAVAGTALLFASASWSIPLVLGPRYMDAVPAFRILLLAFPLMSVNYVLTHQLIGWHGQGTYAVVCACALAVNLALNRWLIPSAGIDGAAWATVWTEVVVGGGCGLALRRQMTRVAT